MAKKLFVGNLPYSISEDQLKELFSEFGAIESIAIITDKFSGRSKGFGFVEMSTDEEAQAAIEKLNGYQIEGRGIIVNEARPPQEGRRMGGGRQGGGRFGRSGGGYGRRDY